MEYEIVTLEEKIVKGISARTNNTSPDMGMVIGGLWERFYNAGVCASIANKKSEKALGIYTDYASNELGDYTVMVACEVNEADTNKEDIEVRRIPAGKYAKFVVHGDMKEAVQDAWQKIWQMELPRSFEYDFEEYQNSDMENAEIHIYISLQD